MNTPTSTQPSWPVASPGEPRGTASWAQASGWHNLNARACTLLPQSPPAQGWALLSAQGDEAVAFLHGQLTQDVKLLGDREARWAAYCSVKGRVQASSLVWKPRPDAVWLACHESVAAAWLQRLKMFVMRARCTLAADTASGLWGWASPEGMAPPELLALPEMAHSGTTSPGQGSWLRLSTVEGWVRGLYLSEQAPPGEAAGGLGGLWDWLQVRSGVPVITQATVEQFVPQMVNFEVVGGVNFKKGCYPGQEVVARAQYRGTVKRRLFLMEGPAPAQAGQAVFAAGHPDLAPAGPETPSDVEPVGTVVNAAPCPLGEPGAQPGPGRWSALVELRLQALSADFRLASPDGPPLTLAPQPYVLPSDDVA